MSEPMSSVEIEDVLSSIRRLVSEDLRPAARPTSETATSHAAAQMAASKLILTPALRVVPDEAPPAAVPVPVPPTPEPEAWDEGEVAGFVNVEDDAVFDNDPDGQTAAAVVSLTSALDVPAPVPVAEPAPDTLLAPEPILMPEAVDWDDIPPQPAGFPDWQEAGPVDAALSAAPAPDGDDEAKLDAVWADAAEAEVLRQLADEGVSPQAAPISDDDRMYEETLLRDLVRDIIREELQGELGERITRNVRKLVRAEIARAMALRDFD